MKFSKSILIFMLTIFSINTVQASLVIALDLGDEKENKEFLQKLKNLRTYLKHGKALKKGDKTNLLVKDNKIMGLDKLIKRLMKIKKRTGQFKIKDVKRPHITLLVIREDQQKDIIKHLQKKGLKKPQNLFAWKALKEELIKRIKKSIQKATKKKKTKYKIMIKKKAKVFGKPQKEKGKRKHFYVGQKTEISDKQKDTFKKILKSIRNELKSQKIDCIKWYSVPGHGHISEIEIHPVGVNGHYQIAKMIREEMLGRSKKTEKFLNSVKLFPPKEGVHGRIMLMETDKGTVKKIIARF